ncbi:MAG: VWA domain-containing protein [Verrucomicrobiota bacterium]|nr:VWA domain-containing protein [Verrucomicrobiota bacterium]
MKKSSVLFGMALALGLSSIARSEPVLKPESASTVEEKPLVQLALLLDTSNSMDGLIQQAKTQLWRIVNEFLAARQDGRTPQVEVALYEYGNDNLQAGEGFVRQVAPLTQDLDKVSEALFGLRTRGGSEYCGWVIRDSVQGLQWNPSAKVYKAIFIAGNEPFTQGAVEYREACKSAVERGIIVNTIHCGSESDGVNGKWRDGAALADGRFLTINQDARVADVPAPQDKEIAELNTKLNSTYVAYGRRGAEGKHRQEAQDSNAAATSAPASVTAQRALTKSSGFYTNPTWDLVDAATEKNFDLGQVKEEELPEELRKLSLEDRRRFLESKRQERTTLQEQIQKLSADREKFIAAARKEQSAGSTLDQAVTTAIREQAHKKAFQFDQAGQTR